jgi:dipeptidyl aminopeptidase/acylaminoacyl peptidase
MPGLTNGDPAFEAGEYSEQSSSVTAVVEMFGPMDLTAKMGWLQRMLLRRAFGTDDPGAAVLADASPINYIKPGTAPFLILHSEQDDAVPVEQAQVFLRILNEAGVPASLVIVKNANHNFKPTGGVIQPSRAEISSMMADFFETWLK